MNKNDNKCYGYLSRINTPDDLKNLTYDELGILAEEIRLFLLDTVSKTGGHIASNLGVVELTLALHKVLNAPLDKIIWDVGHQTYVHKILTGRKDSFESLRQFGGIAGFKTQESEYDILIPGIAVLQTARWNGQSTDLKTEDYTVAAVGRGFIGGMALEALNDAGISD